MWNSEQSDEPKFTLCASKDNWIEGEAVEQLKRVAKLPGITQAFGMPDLHPGKGIPIGAVALSREMVYPHLVGNDIGCGMAFWQMDLKRRKFKRDKCAKRLAGLESSWHGDRIEWLQSQRLPADLADEALGTIGGGNHFAELQAVDQIHDESRFQALDLDAERLMLLVHSGSRGLGESVLRSHVAKHGASGLSDASPEAQDYLQKHNQATTWASANRRLIAYRFADQLGTDHRFVLDLCHNSVSRIELEEESWWIHRKGAAPANAGPVIVPGSRGTLSYLVEPRDKAEEHGWSLAHGAGRKWNRKSARARLEKRYSPESLIRTDLGGTVICECTGSKSMRIFAV